MGEIININVGKAGIKIGQKFLENIAKEHFHDKLDSRGKFDVFFNSTPQQNHESRSLFFDLHPSTMQSINCKNKNYTIPENNLFKGSGIFSDLFATGIYCEGCQIVNQTFNKVRKQVQKCDRLSGFLIINSIGGGTGGGMTSKILMKLRQNYCSSVVQDHIVVPECNSICSPLHIYNSVLSFNPVIENTDLCLLAQNSAFDQKLLLEGNFRPSLDEINAVHAQNICQTTAPYRFNGNLNTSQRKICVNMVMFPRMKFLISSFSNKKVKFNHIEDALNARNHSKRDFFSYSPGIGDIFNLQMSCRDNFAYQSQVDLKVNTWIKESKLSFTDWIVNSTHVSMTEPAFINNPSSSVLINSRHVIKIFVKWANSFTAMFRRRAFIHHFQAFGMDEMQFVEAESNLNDIISQYTPCTAYDDQDYSYLGDAPQ